MKTLLGLYTFNNDEFKNNFNYICLDELELKKKKVKILAKPHF